MTLSAAVEGDLDELVLRRVLSDFQLELGPVYGKSGKQFLRKKITAYNRAAGFSPWIVLVDLDAGVDCAPTLVSEWLPSRSPQMSLRIAVRAVEAWLLSDRTRVAKFLGVRAADIPAQPELLLDPKRALVDAANKSRRRELRMDIVPRPGSGTRVGPGYSSRVAEFINELWVPADAEEHADSLRRCRQRLSELSGRHRAIE